MFINSSPISQDKFLDTVEGRPSEMKPVWYQVASREEQTQKIADIISQARGSISIGILFRHKLQMNWQVEALSRKGIRVQTASRDTEYSFGNVSIPTVTTIHSAKGLEFDWVILPDLNKDVWSAAPNDLKERRLFFVALTRTKSNLYLISQTGREFALLHEIMERDPGLIQIPGNSAYTFHSTSPRMGHVVQNDEDDPF